LSEINQAVIQISEDFNQVFEND